MTVDELATALQQQYGLSREVALRRAEAALPGAAIAVSTEPPGMNDTRLEALEKDEQRAVRTIFIDAGCKVYWLSQARKTKQTPGIPDLWVVHTGKALAFWWETKVGGGRYSPEQIKFAEECMQTNMAYGSGDRHAARDFVELRGLRKEEAAA